MSKLKRGYQAFSPFPKTGLVKDHEGKIRSMWVGSARSSPICAARMC